MDDTGAVVLRDQRRGQVLNALSDEEQAEFVALSQMFVSNIPYCPWTPNEGPQTAFLLDFGRESLYGGAAGGGKSIAIMMAASQFLHVPGYSALLLRKTFADLERPLALMDIAEQWWKGQPGVHFDRQKHRYTFETIDGGRSRIEFGGLDNDNDRFKYQGGAFHFVGFDEVTQQRERDYRYLFSRMRRVKTGPLSRIPIRMRLTANPGGCVREGDVLTPNGWVDITTMQPGDPVFTVMPDGEMVETVVDRVYRLPWDGEMVRATARGLTVEVTPDHRVAKVGGVRGAGRGAAYSLVPFDNLPGQATILRSVRWEGKPLPSFSPDPMPGRRTKHNQPTSLPGDKFATLLGWYLSEGCTIDRDKAVNIAQSKPVTSAKLRAFLDDCGFIYSWSTNGATIYARDWWIYFRQFGHCRDKFIPEWVKAGSAEDLRCLFDALVDGDGHWVTQESGQYYTTSIRLAEDVSEVALKLGFVVHMSERQRDDRTGLSYCVNFKRTESGGTELLTGNHSYVVETETKRRSDIERFHHKGDVYCLGIDGPQTFMIRQHGSVWVSGNSGHEWVYKRFIARWEAWRKGLAARPPRNFWPAVLSDNPKLDAEDYIASLNELDPITRAQLLRGDWNIRPDGRMFKRKWFKLVTRDQVPGNCTWVRFWDMASTEEMKANGVLGDPDFTAGALVGRAPNGAYYIVDMKHWRHEAADNDLLVGATAVLDTPRVHHIMEQEPGASGKIAVHHYRTQVYDGTGVNFRGIPSTGSKIVRANPVASHADAGNVYIVADGTWDSEAFLSEIEMFPDATHDDMVDAVSGAFSVLAKMHRGTLDMGGNAEFHGANQWVPDAQKHFGVADVQSGFMRGIIDQHKTTHWSPDMIRAEMAQRFAI